MRLERERILAACKASELSSVHIKPNPEANPGVTDSKFGGEFYLPAGAEAPAMEFLAQVNLAQIPPLEGFPEKGLLQFFLVTEEGKCESFLEDGNAWKMDAGFFKVVYYPEVLEGAAACENRIPEERWQMDALTGGMEFEMAEELASVSMDEDGGFLFDLGYEFLSKTLAPVFEAAWNAEEDEEDEDAEDENVYDLENSCEDTDRFMRDFTNWGFKLGGHPALRQGEFRLDEKGCQDYTVLLFQYDLTALDPEELEADTFCFFIKPEDLDAGRFDDILMVHHNCY